jgi:cytochrome c oxidase assembly protein subunit 15
VCAAATFFLLGVGGLVTSHGVGMAVPDWPNTYGYNMFLFPFSSWVGGVFYEHSHRLAGALVGVLTTILAIWLWVRETAGARRWMGVGMIVAVLGLLGARSMPVYYILACASFLGIGWGLYRFVSQPARLRWCGIIAFSAVILQGVLGGLRVVWMQDALGILHAALAQLFFAWMCAIGWFTSRSWTEWQRQRARMAEGSLPISRSDQPLSQPPSRSGLAVHGLEVTSGACHPLPSALLLGTTILIFIQLLLGAAMRHQHAGLAIPDFPLAYGRLWPATDAGSVVRYNQRRLEVTALNPITALQIHLQMIHRIMAVCILACAGVCAWKVRRQGAVSRLLRNGCFLWAGLVMAQALLGAATIWSNKAADVATAHVLVGALCLAVGVLLWIEAAARERAAGYAGEKHPLSVVGATQLATVET